MPRTIGRFLALAALLLALAVPGRARAEDDGPFVVFDAGDAAATMPKGQGAAVARVDAEGKPAAQVDVAGGSAWARIYFRSVPTDVRTFSEIEITFRSATKAAGQDFQVQLADDQDRNALVKVTAPKSAWETRKVRLADAVVPPGFDPATVKMLLLNWYKPTGSSIQIARVAFLHGEGGWRMSDDELVAKVFGEKRAKAAKLEATEHFDVWSDAPTATAKALGADLEKEATAAAFVFQLPHDGLKGFRMPVYAFKSPADYRDYCQRVLGWNEEQSKRRPATGTAGEVVLTIQNGFMPDRVHRVGRAVFAHAFGPGGGAWLQDGAGELTVRFLEEKKVAKEIAPRLKAGGLWPMASLLGADALYSAEANTSATYDYRPVFLHAASVVEFLVHQPPTAAPGAAASSDPGAERLKALGLLRSRGEARVAEIEKILGQPAAQLETAWRAWVQAQAK